MLMRQFDKVCLISVRDCFIHNPLVRELVYFPGTRKKPGCVDDGRFLLVLHDEKGIECSSTRRKTDVIQLV